MALKIPDTYECSQCGSTSFTREGDSFLRCAYCSSLYQIPSNKKKKAGTTVHIKKGANVIFGNNSNVTIRGELLIDDGARVSFHGKLNLIEKSNDGDIEEAKKKLKNSTRPNHEA